MPPRNTAPLQQSTNSNRSAAAPDRSDDDSVNSVKNPAADLVDSGDESDPRQREPERRKSWIVKLKPQSLSSGREELMRMTGRDYLRDWARDQAGKYIGTEPQGQGRRVLRMKKQGLSVWQEARKSEKAEDRFGMVEDMLDPNT